MDLEKSYKCGVITVSPVIMEARKKKSNIPILFNEQQEKKKIKIIKKKPRFASSVHCLHT